MMNFFRKYQKIFFITITVMIVISFSFFGTFSTMAVADKVVEKEVTKALDGSSITDREVHAMSRFLSIGETAFLQNDFLGSGLAAILGEKYFSEIREDFEGKMARAKKFRSYRHPQAPFISAEEVWKRFSPGLFQHLQQLKEAPSSPEAFALYAQLYLDQAYFPPHLLGKVLSYQEQQYNFVQHDPNMNEQHLALFGYQTLEDWFGPKFMELTCRFLVNASLVAQEKGYKISNEEARADLLQNALSMLQTYTQKKDLTYADADELLRHQLQSCGVDEVFATKTWKKVMLSRRLFDEVGQGVFLDGLTYEQFAAYAGEKATVELYQLPSEMRFSRPREQYEFQFYLDMVSSKNRGKLPPVFLSPAAVEKKCPELVQSRFLLEVSKVSKEELALSKITLKETWDFEVSNEGWNALLAQFPILAKSDPKTRDERYQALEGLENNFRLKVDHAARHKLLDKHPEWMEEALSLAPKEQYRIGIRSKGATFPFTDVEETADLLTQLYKAPLNETLPLFMGSQKTLYRITVLEKPAGKQVMTFYESMQNGLLSELVDKQLEAAYPDARKKNPKEFQLENGSWKPFQDVKDEVAKLVCEEKNPLIAYVQECRKNPNLVASGDPLKDQFLLVKSTQEFKRSDAGSLLADELFKIQEGAWSSLQTPKNGDISFYRLVKRENSTDSVSDQVSEGHKILSMDARRFLMYQLLERM